MIGGQLPTDQQMKIMAEQLRGRDARAMLATLSGDTALTNVGKLMSGRTDKLATGLLMQDSKSTATIKVL